MGCLGLVEGSTVCDSEPQIEPHRLIAVKNLTASHSNTVEADETSIQVRRAKGRKAVELIVPPDAFY